MKIITTKRLLYLYLQSSWTTGRTCSPQLITVWSCLIAHCGRWFAMLTPYSHILGIFRPNKEPCQCWLANLISNQPTCKNQLWHGAGRSENWSWRLHKALGIHHQVQLLKAATYSIPSSAIWARKKGWVNWNGCFKAMAASASHLNCSSPFSKATVQQPVRWEKLNWEFCWMRTVCDVQITS